MPIQGSYFTPSPNPVNVAFRPLTGGMRPDKPPTSLTPAEVLLAKGLIPDTRGLRKSPGYVADFNGDAADFPPVLGFSVFYELDGTEVQVVWDRKFIYAASGAGFIGVYSKYEVGTAKTSGTFLVGSATTAFTAVASDIRVGDQVAVGAGASLEVIGVAGVTSSHVLSLAAIPSMSHAVGSDYEVRRAFGALPPSYVDGVEVSNLLILTDGVRPLQKYNGSTYGQLEAGLSFLCSCVAYHGDRLWAGGITDSVGTHNQRIMWTTTLSRVDFGVVGTDQFVDRPYAPGKLLRLVPLGAYLVAYYEDAVDLGRPTNIAGDDLPYSFSERFQTGGVGLVGPKAVTPWVDGHFFVGQDDVYYLGLSSGLERIGTPIIQAALRECLFPASIWVVPDLTRNRIVFGIPESSEDMTRLWSFNYLTKAWAYEECLASALGSIWGLGGTISGLDALSGTISGLDAVSGTVAGLGNSVPVKELILADPSGYVWRTQDALGTDKDGNPISVEIETGDFDFDDPDRVKSAYRLSLKIDRVFSEDVVFSVLGSTNEGISWRSLGIITLSAGRDEGYVNFQLTGPTLRFRILSTSSVSTYTVLEYVLRMRGRGLEAQHGATD